MTLWGEQAWPRACSMPGRRQCQHPQSAGVQLTRSTSCAHSRICHFPRTQASHPRANRRADTFDEDLVFVEPNSTVSTDAQACFRQTQPDGLLAFARRRSQRRGQFDPHAGRARAGWATGAGLRRAASRPLASRRVAATRGVRRKLVLVEPEVACRGQHRSPSPDQRVDSD